MKRLMLATATAALMLAGVGAATAQNFQGDGPEYGTPFMSRDSGLRPYYRDDDGYRAPGSGDRSTYNSNAFRSQEVWPQSPPEGGY